MKILLTGGAGFIGSHTLIELTEAGHEAVVVDNLDNSSPISLKRVAKIIGKDVPFYTNRKRRLVMSEMRDRNFVPELVYRTKVNYYAMRLNDTREEEEILNGFDEIKKEMREKK